MDKALAIALVAVLVGVLVELAVLYRLLDDGYRVLTGYLADIKGLAGAVDSRTKRLQRDLDDVGGVVTGLWMPSGQAATDPTGGRHPSDGDAG